MSRLPVVGLLETWKASPGREDSNLGAEQSLTCQIERRGVGRRGLVMKERGVAIRSIVPLVLCASAAARMSLTGRSAFANNAVFSRGPASAATARGILYARILTSGRRNSSGLRKSTAPRADSAAVITARFSSSSDTAEDDLDARVKAAVAALPQRPRCAVVGAGFAGLATAYFLAAFGSDVTVFDPNEVGTGGASSVAAGLLHPLTPRGKLIWKGEEGFVAAVGLIEVKEALDVLFCMCCACFSFTILFR